MHAYSTRPKGFVLLSWVINAFKCKESQWRRSPGRLHCCCFAAGAWLIMAVCVCTNTFLRRRTYQEINRALLVSGQSTWRPDSVVPTVSRLRAVRYWVRNLARVRQYSVLQNVQTAFGTQVTSCSVDTGDSFPWYRAVRAWGGHSLSPGLRFWMSGATPPIALCLHGVHRFKLTCYKTVENK
jgi:hypothetical protein